MVALAARGEPLTPTLAGRIQTRVFILLTVGSLVTLAITPLLGLHEPLSSGYIATFGVLGAVIVFGVGWELLYHLLQQLRWEKDWPTLFGLLTGVNEGLVMWWVVSGVIPGVSAVPLPAFITDFAVVWVASWLVANGPLRVLFPRWRYRGGEIW